ncbi:MAG: helix-turn-helix domain-containing protein [Pseudonocardiaceae bacterium]
MDDEVARAIGARARMIRRRRGLSLEVVAGLAGITKTYLSMLELGQRGFNRRGLIEDLAEALGCSVADLTGQPYLAPDRATLEGRAALPGISLALNDVGPDEVPDVTPRPLDELVAWAERANEHRDQGRHSLAGRDLGTRDSTCGVAIPRSHHRPVLVMTGHFSSPGQTPLGGAGWCWTLTVVSGRRGWR